MFKIETNTDTETEKITEPQFTACLPAATVALDRWWRNKWKTYRYTHSADTTHTQMFLATYVARPTEN